MMLSWSHRLFLQINAQIGKRPWLDRGMVFCAQWLIWIEGAFLLFFVHQHFFYPGKIFPMVDFFLTGGFFLVVGVLTYFVSLMIAVLVKRPRPIKEFPQIQMLIKPMSLWKTFPSDHAALSLLMAFVSLYFVEGAAVVPALFLLGAILVAIARVYVGVHYPRDILGGWGLSLGVFCVLHYGLGVLY